ncbi:MAG: hypothetical protein K2H90_08065 [Oscillospiraceae bacterium]|nr:hypothetical protein [Oscillospiraceae bacterium]
MKIIAHFDSPDSADFAAGALKNALSPLASVETKERSAHKQTNKMNTVVAFNTTTNNPTYSMPLSFPSHDNESEVFENDYISAKHIVEVVCRSEDAAKASRIIIGHGGRDITRLT